MSKVSVVLALKQTSDAKVCVDGDNYVACITDPANLNFVVPAVSAAVAAIIVEETGIVKTNVLSLRAALSEPKSETKQTDIKTARWNLDNSLTKLAHSVEGVANGSTVPDENRVGILHSAGMDEKTHSNPQKHKFKVSNTDISGKVHAEAEGGANAHEWAYTPDLVGFTNRTALESTTTAHTDAFGLTPKEEYAFFHKAIYPGNNNVWEGPIFLVVT